MSPAFNLDLQSIIFSSLIQGTAGAYGAEYKLTIKDTNLVIAKTDGSEVTRAGNVVTVPYTITGSNSGNATQVSVLLTDTPYSAGTVATTGYAYLKLSVDTWGTSGTGTFTLPDAYIYSTYGTDYYAYILAEDVNDNEATDYASKPVQITIPDGPPRPTPDPSTSSAPSGDDARYDGGSSDNKTQDEKPFDYYDDLRAKLDTAIALGGERTVTLDEGTALPYDIMKTLQDNPKITLVFSYKYKNTNYKVTISGKDVKAYKTIPWYGPIYLYTYYGGSRVVQNVQKVNATNGTYTVVNGDTLTDIAIKLNTSVKRLVALNNIKDPDKLIIGQVLKY